MDDQQRVLNKKYETVAWGAFFIVLGVTSLFSFLPNGTGTIGIGLILLGLNVARYYAHLPTSGFTITLGVIALVLGLFDVLRAVLGFSAEGSGFALVLIVIGVILVGREFLRVRKN